MVLSLSAVLTAPFYPGASITRTEKINEYIIENRLEKRKRRGKETRRVIKIKNIIDTLVTGILQLCRGRT